MTNLTKTIDTMLDACYAGMAGEGGDGWALWCTKMDLKQILRQIKKRIKDGVWPEASIGEKPDIIVVSWDQESITVTNSQEYYDDEMRGQHHWHEFVLRY